MANADTYRAVTLELPAGAWAPAVEKAQSHGLTLTEVIRDFLRCYVAENHTWPVSGTVLSNDEVHEREDINDLLLGHQHASRSV